MEGVCTKSVGKVSCGYKDGRRVEGTNLLVGPLVPRRPFVRRGRPSIYSDLARSFRLLPSHFHSQDYLSSLLRPAGSSSRTDYYSAIVSVVVKSAAVSAAAVVAAAVVLLHLLLYPYHHSPHAPSPYSPASPSILPPYPSHYSYSSWSNSSRYNSPIPAYYPSPPNSTAAHPAAAAASSAQVYEQSTSSDHNSADRQQYPQRLAAGDESANSIAKSSLCPWCLWRLHSQVGAKTALACDCGPAQTYATTTRTAAGEVGQPCWRSVPERRTMGCF